MANVRSMKGNGHRQGIVLVTGGAGYLGSQLIRDLVMDANSSEVTVRVLDNLLSRGYRALMDLPTDGRFEFVEADVLDAAAVRRALRDVDCVVHLASVTSTPLSFEHPAWTEQIDHWGAMQVVEHCLDAGVERIVLASSTGVYGPGGPFDERAVCRPIGPYAQAKLRAESALLAARDRGLEPTILRFGTLFGDAPTIRFDGFANRLAYLAGVGRPVSVYGTGEQVRPLVCVQDASAAIGFCLAAPEATVGRTFNVVGENASVQDVVDTLRRIRPDLRVHHTEQDVLTHFSFAADGQKLRKAGWQPRIGLADGLARLVGRFRNLGRPLVGDSELLEEVGSWEG